MNNYQYSKELVSEKSQLPLENINLVLSHFISRLKISELINFNNKESMYWFLKAIKKLSEDYTTEEISISLSQKKDIFIDSYTGAPSLFYVKILIGVLFSEELQNGESYLINLLMPLFEENSITGTIYFNTYEEIENMTGETITKDSIIYLSTPIKRYSFVSDKKTIKAIKDKIRYYTDKYDIQSDKYINISNTLLIIILMEIIKAKKVNKSANGKRRKQKTNIKSKQTKKQRKTKKQSKAKKTRSKNLKSKK